MLALCVQLGGEIEKRSHKKSYYGSCIISEDKFLDLFSQKEVAYRDKETLGEEESEYQDT